MRRLTDKNIIKSGRRSSLPDFREPEIDIEGVDLKRTSRQAGARTGVPFTEKYTKVSQIGVPEDLSVDEERIVKKGASTFIDVFISFEPAAGAQYHEFRVAKITLDESVDNGE